MAKGDVLITEKALSDFIWIGVAVCVLTIFGSMKLYNSFVSKDHPPINSTVTSCPDCSRVTAAIPDEPAIPADEAEEVEAPDVDPVKVASIMRSENPSEPKVQIAVGVNKPEGDDPKAAANFFALTSKNGQGKTANQAMIDPQKFKADVFVADRKEGGKNGSHWSGVGVELEARPYQQKINDKNIFTAGIFTGGVSSHGTDGAYKYAGKEWNIGPSVGFEQSDGRQVINAGIGGANHEGHQGAYKNFQDDQNFVLRARAEEWGRRSRGEEWYPGGTASIFGSWAYNSDRTSSYNGTKLKQASNNNDYWGVDGILWLKDFTADNGLRASIGPNASVMHFNQNGDTRLGIGPSAEIAYNDVALVSAGARFDKDGIDRFATVDLYGLYKAAKREQIKKQPTVN